MLGGALVVTYFGKVSLMHTLHAGGVLTNSALGIDSSSTAAYYNTIHDLGVRTTTSSTSSSSSSSSSTDVVAGAAGAGVHAQVDGDIGAGEGFREDGTEQEGEDEPMDRPSEEDRKGAAERSAHFQ